MVRLTAPNAHSNEQIAQIMNVIPVDISISPKPTNGETIPPAAKHSAPSKAEAAPEY